MHGKRRKNIIAVEYIKYHKTNVFAVYSRKNRWLYYNLSFVGTPQIIVLIP